MAVTMPSRNFIEGTKGYGVGGIKLLSVNVCDDEGHDVVEAEVGTAVRVIISARAERAVSMPNLGFSLFAPDGSLIYAITLKNLKGLVAEVAAGTLIRETIRIVCDLAPGAYGLTVVAGDNHKTASEDSGVHHDTREGLGPLIVRAGADALDFHGRVRLPFSVGVLG